MSELRPASELAEKGSKPFPNEPPEYREARTKLLEEEIELRRQIQRVAALRRQLPDGSEARDYRFLDAAGKEHRFADLFGRHDTLVTYFWMYGPDRERPCPMCTSGRAARYPCCRHRAARCAYDHRTLTGLAPARVRARAGMEETQILPDGR